MKHTLKSLLVVSFLNSSTITNAAPSKCMPINYLGLTKHLSKFEEASVVFFASWCGECKNHLLDPSTTEKVLIATFDNAKAAEAILAKFNLKQPCFLDNGVSEKLAINKLPAVWKWSKKSLSKQL